MFSRSHYTTHHPSETASQFSLPWMDPPDACTDEALSGLPGYPTGHEEPSCDQLRTPILEAIRRVAETRTVSFQTPGHTGGAGLSPELLEYFGENLFRMDVSVCADIDSLSHPQTFIHEAQRLYAHAYGVTQSFFLVNGSTTGNLAMLVATLNAGDKIILPRYVHRSILDALALSRAIPIWVANEIHPAYQIPLPLTAAQIATALWQHPDAKAVLINTPTYHGLCCNIREIAETVHRTGKLLLVDEAWGAHLAFHPDYPESAVHHADLCVQSLHKTLPVSNQGAVLHCNGTRIDIDHLAHVLTMFQTTSPSYVLLSMMDAARKEMVQHGQEILTAVQDLTAIARTQIATVPGLQCLVPEELPEYITLDPMKLVIHIDGTRFRMTGYALEEALCQRFNIQIEMAGPNYILILIKPGICQQDLLALVTALHELHRDSLSLQPHYFSAATTPPNHWESVLSPAQAFTTGHYPVHLENSIGCFCWGAVYAYPPGTPVLVPGERITHEVVEYLQQLIRLGAQVKGLTEHQEILVCEPQTILPACRPTARRKKRSTYDSSLFSYR
ncbi:MAG TPA: aminotransferase class I/II-fold pyridoxal phosphate-dependent enzyme [Armatimonadota bacterium]|nr:aminotransferase class I/II-fold pyridoxal phosphate-dependent enzyme [Armatimonadota bacterium]